MDNPPIKKTLDEVRASLQSMHDNIIQRQLPSIYSDAVQYLDLLEELYAAALALKQINDSGEQFLHPNADGASALARLFNLLADDDEDDDYEMDYPDTEDVPPDGWVVGEKPE